MPSRGSYRINNVEEGKAAARDQSYRSCVATLLIFLFLCVFLIIITLPWSTYRGHPTKEEYDEMGTAEFHHNQHHREDQTEQPASTTLSIKDYANTETIVDIEKDMETTVTEYEISTERFGMVDNINPFSNTSEFEKILIAETTTENTTTISTGASDDFIGETLAYDHSTINANSSEIINDEFDSTTEVYTTENVTDDGANYTTEILSSSFVNWSSYEETTVANVYENTATDISSEFTSETEESATIKSTTESFENTIADSTIPSTVNDDGASDPATATSDLPINELSCTTGECKNMASKMLFYMNHTVDPCEDFYEYACGGFEASPLIVGNDAEDAAYRRILRQMEKDGHGRRVSLFAKYYNSCMQYEDIEQTERIKMARTMLDEVGKFYTIDEWYRNPTNFTELLAKLLLRNSALLFDVAPDLDEYSPKQFTLRIGPTIYDNPFEPDQTEDPCYASQSERDQEIVDSRKLYTEYKICRNDTQKFIKSISEALSVLGVFKGLNNSFITQHVNITCINIDLEIVQKFFANFPSKEKIREAYLMKNYTRLAIQELEERFKVVNWTQLIQLLTKELVKPELMVQVYFYDALAKGLESLYDFSERDPMLLNNALLGLYARNLYHELVLTKHRDAKQQCLRIAANVLIPEASNLYISSFSDNELAHMKHTIQDLFDKLKETLRLNVDRAEWATQEERRALTEKINDLKVAVPDISYFTDSRSTYRKNQTNEITLTNNYLENSVRLMERYRKLVYAELYTNPGDPAQIWTHYATPYQSKGLAIYGLNLVVIPFGVIDWSVKYNELQFDYIIMGSLGNVIAHQIAHHFDANGIYYWNGKRDEKNSLLNENDSTSMNFKEYINNQRNVLYQGSMSITLPSTGQNVFYEISQLTLNERLSETMGLRLAYDTLDRLRSPEEVHLPWFKRDFDQLFYLTYAQMHCTKSPLSSLYISLYENEQLPSRIRIFISASNNRLLGQAWNCPDGSQIMPSYTCSPFPYLECNEVTQVTMMRK